ncbi:unnamed protein product, partial [Protopolystoma xenopodis]
MGRGREFAAGQRVEKASSARLHHLSTSSRVAATTPASNELTRARQKKRHEEDCLGATLL